MDFAENFQQALSYGDFLDRHASPDQRQQWDDFHRSIQLTTGQRDLLAGFTRQQRVLCLAGSWCGDCVRQGPIAQAIADANPCIDLRLIDRDHDASPVADLAINAGARVPVTVFMAEDFEPVSVFGDRTIHYYRHMAAQQFGASCPVPGAGLPDDVQAAAVQDWLDEFERVHLLLRLSGGDAARPALAAACAAATGRDRIPRRGAACIDCPKLPYRRPAIGGRRCPVGGSSAGEDRRASGGCRYQTSLGSIARVSRRNSS